MHPYLAVPATLALVVRAWSNKSLTPTGIIVAALTALIHALHPWNVFFVLLVVFFLGGTAVTKVKHDVKAQLTSSSTGASGGEGPRTYIQVLSNSIVASVLVFLHYRQLLVQARTVVGRPACWPYGQELLVVGIISNYAAVAADTFSSELGILSKSKPRLITSLGFRVVPPGTNGGITLTGTLAGFFGAFTIALTSAVLLPFCGSEITLPQGFQVTAREENIWGLRAKILWMLAVTLWGGLGSFLDSFLGGWLQASVIDSRTGKVIEGSGGKKVPVRSPNAKKEDDSSRKIESGLGLLDNNTVNLLMALIMSVGGMIVVGYMWNLPLGSFLSSNAWYGNT
ncbi:hypothetical protein MMC20_006304 [Loxospora ochrophaea]|nr:hypothetical protein [Loxospora ochrophaea]